MGLVAYNLLRYQMVRMAASPKGYTASQLSFSHGIGVSAA